MQTQADRWPQGVLDLHGVIVVMADVGSITRGGSVIAELGIGIEVIFRETSCWDVCEVVCQPVASVAQDSGTDAGDSRRLVLQRLSC